MSKGISTCTYCGARAAMVFRGVQRHALSCDGCGAQLQPPSKAQPKRTKTQIKGVAMQASGLATTLASAVTTVAEQKIQERRARDARAPRRKGLVGRLFDEAVDAIFD